MHLQGFFSIFFMKQMDSHLSGSSREKTSGHEENYKLKIKVMVYSPIKYNVDKSKSIQKKKINAKFHEPR